jgi:aminoglycoside N3'-acetyltransferase
MNKEKKITKESIIDDLKGLGINKGDFLFIKGDLGKIGSPKEIEGSLRNFIIDALLEVVGENGTIMASSYTDLYNFWALKNDNFYTKDLISNAGALPWLFMKNKNVVRSAHPSNSYVAIGKYAHEILDDHTAESTAYSPLGKVVEMNGKFLVFGCIDSNPGMPITHFVEEALSLTEKNILKGLNKIHYYDEDGKVNLFTRTDYGGCYTSIYKLYKKYHKRNLFKIGSIGKAVAVQVSAKNSFNLEYEYISKDNGMISCDNPDCIYCNLLKPRKKNIVLKFFLYRAWIIFFKIIKGKINNKKLSEIIGSKYYYKIDEDPIFANIIEKIKVKYNE